MERLVLLSLRCWMIKSTRSSAWDSISPKLAHITIIIIIEIISTSQHRLHSLLTLANVNDGHSETWNSRVPSSPRCASCYLCAWSPARSALGSPLSGKMAPRFGLFVQEVDQVQGPQTTSTRVVPAPVPVAKMSHLGRRQQGSRRPLP